MTETYVSSEKFSTVSNSFNKTTFVFVLMDSDFCRFFISRSRTAITMTLSQCAMLASANKALLKSSAAACKQKVNSHGVDSYQNIIKGCTSAENISGNNQTSVSVSLRRFWWSQLHPEVLSCCRTLCTI